MVNVTVGVLALQGDFRAHVRALSRAGGAAVEVRHATELAGLAGLVIPGGESTTLLKLMQDEPWFEAIRAFHASGGAVLGTCAGAILLAREVVPAPQPCIGLVDVAIERNAYGRQIDSFEAALNAPGLDGAVRGVFIRAPRFRRVGRGVETIVERDGEPVGVRQGRVVALTFHPELTSDDRLHRYFLHMTSRGSGPITVRPDGHGPHPMEEAEHVDSRQRKAGPQGAGHGLGVRSRVPVR